MEPNGPQSPKYLLSDPLQKGVADLGIKVVLGMKGKMCLTRILLGRKESVRAETERMKVLESK